MTAAASGLRASSSPRSADPFDRTLARSATGSLAVLNVAGLLDAADVHVAERLGRLGGEADPDVLLAVAVAVRAVRGGATCVDLATVPELDPALRWPAPERWVAAVAASPLLSAGVLRLEGTLLYLVRYWQEEGQVVGDLVSREAAGPQTDPDASTRALQRYFPDEGAVEQREAGRTACERWTSVVTGGPGTGKTTTIARLLGVLLAVEGLQLRVALAAPTGKAAARLTEALREVTQRGDFPSADEREVAVRDRVGSLQATTLHSLLGWRPDSSTRFRHHRSNPLPFDVVVVDETSMVSLTMTARLLEAMRPQARLVLVGDADQLASVEAGAVLGDIVRGWSATGPVRRLTTAHRFGRHIRELAESVRAGDADAVLAILAEGRTATRPGEGTVLRATTGADLDDLLRRQAVALHDAGAAGDAAAALAAFEGHRLLCAHRRGPAGVVHWNLHVERLLMDATHQDWLEEWYVGRPFIVDTNDRGLGLWNGDTGVTCVRPGADPGGLRRLVGVVGDRATGPRDLATTRLAEVTTAHAMTVHRSQGSQFDEVTVLLPDPDSRILTRELLYTAVTRARSTVRVVGSDDAVRAAVTRRAQRATGLAQRLG